MRALNPRVAARKGMSAKIALAGPSGSGKTWDALTLACALGERVVLIDTEHGRASLYADEFDFQTVEWHPPYDPTELAEAIRELASDFDAIAVDSLSHFWMGEGGTLDIVDRAAAKSRGNTYAGWKEGTPAQQSMYEAILAAPCHVIATMRSKQDYILEDRGGKQVPVKIGMAPVQRDGAEYEFDVQAEIDMDHRVVIGKTRCTAIDGKVYRPGEVGQLAATLTAWLDPIDPDVADGFAAALNEAGTVARAEWLDRFGGRKPHELRSVDSAAASEFIESLPDLGERPVGLVDAGDGDVPGASPGVDTSTTPQSQEVTA